MGIHQILTTQNLNLNEVYIARDFTLIPQAKGTIAKIVTFLYTHMFHGGFATKEEIGHAAKSHVYTPSKSDLRTTMRNLLKLNDHSPSRNLEEAITKLRENKIANSEFIIVEKGFVNADGSYHNGLFSYAKIEDNKKVPELLAFLQKTPIADLERELKNQAISQPKSHLDSPQILMAINAIDDLFERVQN